MFPLCQLNNSGVTPEADPDVGKTSAFFKLHKNQG